jgi:septum formation inhibitor-activating ATPase MinD
VHSSRNKASLAPFISTPGPFHFPFILEAARAGIDYAFRALAADHVISLVDPANVASIRVADRVGERLEGTTLVCGREAHGYGITR